MNIRRGLTVLAIGIGALTAYWLAVVITAGVPSWWLGPVVWIGTLLLAVAGVGIVTWIVVGVVRLVESLRRH